MSATLTIRLDPDDRELLEEEARARGIGLSTLVREAAQAEASRLRREAIRAEGEEVMAYVREHAGAHAELDLLGTPQIDLS